MLKYVELCVDMRKGRYAKEGLIQFRSVCIQVNVGSLEEVIKHFLKLATDKAEAAQAQARARRFAVAHLYRAGGEGGRGAGPGCPKPCVGRSRRRL